MAATATTLLLGLAPATKAQAPLEHLKPPAGAASFTSNGQVSAPEREYAVKPRLDARQWTPTGLSLSATAWGRSMDLSNRDGWASDPNARPGEMEAGLNWRGAAASATVGYTQPSFGGQAAKYPHSFRPQGLVGLSISFRK